MVPSPRPTVRGLPRAVALLLGLVAALAAPLGTTAADAAAPVTRDGGDEVISRVVTMRVRNTNDTAVLCRADGQAHRLRARLVGPRDAVHGRAGSTGINLLVHDVGTGGGFWEVGADGGRLDYASRLGDRGELSLVLDRLGYDASPLQDGDGTCLGAQAQMIHQVVQKLRSGTYRFTRERGSTPAASFVTLHGHGQGALIAEIEAATFDDVDGLVLMSWAESGRSARDDDESQRERRQCLTGNGRASYGSGPRAYRHLLLAASTAQVRRAATAVRNGVPCGDVESLDSAVLTAQQGNDEIEAPVLLLYGRQDARLTAGAPASQRGQYDAAPSTTLRRYRGGSALPLGRSAAAVRGDVVRWLDAHVG